MTVTCCIRYEIDPHRRDDSRPPPIASLASCKACRARLKMDGEARANFACAADGRFIRREERTFLEAVPSTLPAPSKLKASGQNR